MDEALARRVTAGSVVVLRLYDVAYEIDLAAVETLAAAQVPTARVQLSRVYLARIYAAALDLFRVRPRGDAVDRKLTISDRGREAVEARRRRASAHCGRTFPLVAATT